MPGAAHLRHVGSRALHNKVFEEPSVVGELLGSHLQAVQATTRGEVGTSAQGARELPPQRRCSGGSKAMRTSPKCTAGCPRLGGTHLEAGLFAVGPSQGLRWGSDGRGMCEAACTAGRLVLAGTQAAGQQGSTGSCTPSAAALPITEPSARLAWRRVVLPLPGGPSRMVNTPGWGQSKAGRA